MKTRILGLLVVGLLAGPMAANAIPISYDMTYTADPTSGPDGIGSFVYDADTGSLSGLTWLFNDGLSGLYFDTVDAFLGGNVLLGGCSIACSSSRGGPSISGDFSNLFWSFDSPSTYKYIFQTTADVIYAGSFAVTRAVGVPEPSTLALLGIGLAGIGFSRRRKGS